MLPPHTEVPTDSALEHSYDEDDAHILSPLLDEPLAGSMRVQVTKSNGSRPNSGKEKDGRGLMAGLDNTPMEMRQLMGAAVNKSKAITIGNGNGRTKNYGANSPSASLLRSTRNGSDEEERGGGRRKRMMTIGSSDSSSSSSSSDNEQAEGAAFDSNLKFS